MNREFREFVKAKRTIYAPRDSINMYVNDQEVAKVNDVKVERPWDTSLIKENINLDNPMSVSGPRPTQISSIEEVE
jgi:hypothetical protein